MSRVRSTNGEKLLKIDKSKRVDIVYRYEDYAKVNSYYENGADYEIAEERIIKLRRNHRFHSFTMINFHNKEKIIAYLQKENQKEREKNGRT